MPYRPFDPTELTSAWIELDDSTIENGCVRFAGGSHKLRLRVALKDADLYSFRFRT